MLLPDLSYGAIVTAGFLAALLLGVRSLLAGSLGVAEAIVLLVLAVRFAERGRDPGRTVIVIAHRPATLEAADQVVTLEAGRVTECGPPADLIGSGGAFARLHDQYRDARGWRITG